MFRVNLFEYQQESADIQTQAVPPLLRWLKWTVKMNIFRLRNSIPFISSEMMQMAALIHLWHEYSVCPQAAALLLQDASSLCVRRLSSVHPGTAGNQTGAQQQVSVSWVENHGAEQGGDKCVCWWGVCSTASRMRDRQRYYCNISVCYYCLFCLIINLINQPNR